MKYLSRIHRIKIRMQEIVYQHETRYYETDQMGIIHHSNYIRWMEEARLYFMDTIGFGYVKMEESGVISPVLSVQCDYRKMTRFGDVVLIKIWLKEYKSLKMVMGYEMKNGTTGEICAVAESKNCFLHQDGRPVNLKKEMPEFHQTLKNLLSDEG